MDIDENTTCLGEEVCFRNKRGEQNGIRGGRKKFELKFNLQ